MRQPRANQFGLYPVGVAVTFAVLLVAGLASTRGVTAAGPPWRTHLAAIEDALAAGDVSAATRAWRNAYGAAFGQGDWDAMLAVGRASLRIGDVAGARAGFEAKARQCYLAALFRARHEGSIEGVLRITEAFAELGDQDVVEQGLHIARQVAGQDREALARVHELAKRFVRVLAVDTARLEF